MSSLNRKKMYYMIIGATCIINDTFKSQNDGRLEYLETFAVLKVSWKIKILTFVYNVPVFFFRIQKGVSLWLYYGNNDFLILCQ